LAEGRPPSLRTHDSIVQDGSTRTRGVTSVSPLAQLPYFDIATMTLLDMMHINSGVIGRHLVPALCGGRLKSAGKAEAERHRKEDALGKTRIFKAKQKWEQLNARHLALKKKIHKMKKGDDARIALDEKCMRVERERDEAWDNWMAVRREVRNSYYFRG
jgi:hypothetical protein